MNYIVVVGGDLFRVALAHLGDATQWSRIAALNGLDDPIIEGVVRLALPGFDRGLGGGLAR